MNVVYSENPVHRGNILLGEVAREAAYGPVSATKSADVSLHRTCLVSAIADARGVEVFVEALRGLGDGGS
jgi:hypothetical protein